MFGPDIESSGKKTVEALLVVRGFSPKLMNYVKIINGTSVIFVAVDEWVFERDVDRGFLGEALAWGLIIPYLPLINEDYLHRQEIKLKKRLTLEILENLVLAFPELSRELHIKPDYFMYETVMSRAKLFPPMAYNFEARAGNRGNLISTFNGYVEALKELEREGKIAFSGTYVKIPEKFIAIKQSPRVRLTNLSKTVPRTLFTSFLHVLPAMLNVFSQDLEVLPVLQGIVKGEQRAASSIETPEKYVFVPTASGLVPLANKTSIETFARKILSVGEDAKVETEPIGGILNNVYLVRASVDGVEKKAVVKQFKDWSSFKWFPLTLWGVGTRTFAVSGISRLERECATNQFLRSKGFAVPSLLHVSPSERLVFTEYVEGRNVRDVIQKIANPKTSASVRKDLKIIKRIGKKLAKVHALGIALGDTKPENILIGEHGEVYLMDFEQASHNGDETWDIAEFLYYTGHDIPPSFDTHAAELITHAFLAGYLEAGGKVDTVRRAGNPKYTKVFSIFTLPHVMLAISNICRETRPKA